MTSVCYKNTTHTRGTFLIRSPSSLSHPLPRIMSDSKQPSSQTAGNPMGHSIHLSPANIAPPIPDTSPQALGLDDEGDKSLETSTSGLRRVVEKTVDKLGRTRSLNNKSPSKRIFSLGRNRGKESVPPGAILIPLALLNPTPSRLQTTWRHWPHLGVVIHLMTVPFSTHTLLSLRSARR